MKADPGIGRAGAPIGTIEWAQYLRLHSQPMIDRAMKAPVEAQEIVDFVREHKAWKLMNRPDGSAFDTFDSFCEHPKPYGWGVKVEDLSMLIEAALRRVGVNGKRAVAMLSVPKDGRASREHADDGTFKAKEQNHSPHDEGNGVPPHATRERIRAIDRAPKQVGDLFERDLIGVAEAAKLGPATHVVAKKPEMVERVYDATEKAVAIVDAAKPTTPAEKRKTARKVNAVVREAMGGKPDPVVKLVALARKLSRSDLRRLVDELVRIDAQAAE